MHLGRSSEDDSVDPLLIESRREIGGGMAYSIFGSNLLGGFESSTYHGHNFDFIDFGDGIEMFAPEGACTGEQDLDGYELSSRTRCPMAVLLPGT